MVGGTLAVSAVAGLAQVEFGRGKEMLPEFTAWLPSESLNWHADSRISPSLVECIRKDHFNLVLTTPSNKEMIYQSFLNHISMSTGISK